MKDEVENMSVIATRILVACAAWASFGPCGAGAAEAAAGPPQLRTEISNISETRSPDGRCNIGLKITGEALADRAAIFRVKVIRAVDDTGVNLVLPERENQGGWGTSGGRGLSPVRGSWDLGHSKTRFANFQLAAAARGARQITDLQGELELLTPTFENGGVVTIEDFRLQPGKPLQDKRLLKHGVALTYLDKESYETAKTAARSGIEGNHQRPPSVEEWADGLFPGVLGEPNRLGRNYVVLKVDDPQQQVAAFAFREPGGRVLPVLNRKTADEMLGFYFDSVPPEKLSLVVYLAVPQALERVPFGLKNIRLP
jgi:hypothetical protein